MHRIGVDLGGTKIEGIVLDTNDHEVFRKRVPTEQEHGYDHIIGNIAGLYRDLVASIDGAEHTFGLGTPGALSIRTGLLKNSNTVCMNGMPVKEDIEARIGRRIAIQNDANCFAMAEALDGAGKGKNLVFGVIMGTGCGGGIVFNKQVVTGVQAIAGEWGHMSIDPNGPVCYCGQPGCVETYISGGGLEKRWIEQHGERRPMREIEGAYYAGDKDAVDFMTVFFRNFGRAMANLINILDPDIIVLGGGVSKFKAIYDKGLEQVEHFVFSDSLETAIVQHQLGDSAGVIGAALIGV
ncbi:MAG: ROK family protein [Candidatus Pacebacteria bacterium]|nr:ROK family protein [Candidatus Paceibacterota bacterium]